MKMKIRLLIVLSALLICVISPGVFVVAHAEEEQIEESISPSLSTSDNAADTGMDDNALLSSTAQYSESENKRIGIVTTQDKPLNVRSGSGTEYEILAQLKKGETVEIIGEENGWYQVLLPKTTGYVYGKYLTLSSESKTPYSEENPQNISPLTPDGNMTLVDDVGETTGAGKQFVTIVTKNGNYFYLIIDRDEKGEGNVHFLNQVDEKDLLSLMDKEEASAIKDVPSDPGPEKSPDPINENTSEAVPSLSNPSTNEEEPEKKSNGNFLLAMLLLILTLGGGAAFFFIQLKKKKKHPVQIPDPDADYAEEEETDFDALSDESDMDIESRNDEEEDLL